MTVYNFQDIGYFFENGEVMLNVNITDAFPPKRNLSNQEVWFALMVFVAIQQEIDSTVCSNSLQRKTTALNQGA